MSSLRLPGKVLADIIGKPMLSYVVERARRSGACDEVVVATSEEKEDDAIAAFCSGEKVSCFRGSLTDVLDRYVRAARAFNADAVVRLTADCPLLDPAVTRTVIEQFKERGVDYGRNVWPHTFPIGLDTEVCTTRALIRAGEEAEAPYDREHVTSYFRRRADLFSSHVVVHPVNLSHLRWTVDTADDLRFVRAVYEHFGAAPFGMEEILSFLESRPDIAGINAPAVSSHA
jgi:spore coat polysaccharide biosynthesis protein SpsF (cytidylyltransferase family)